jgi:hypothetical protein
MLLLFSFSLLAVCPTARPSMVTTTIESAGATPNSAIAISNAVWADASNVIAVKPDIFISPTIVSASFGVGARVGAVVGAPVGEVVARQEVRLLRSIA